MTEINNDELMQNILSCARDVADGIKEISELSEEAGHKAGIYAERTAATAASLRNEACAHMRALVEDMEQAVKIKL